MERDFPKVTQSDTKDLRFKLLIPNLRRKSWKHTCHSKCFGKCWDSESTTAMFSKISPCAISSVPPSCFLCLGYPSSCFVARCSGTTVGFVVDNCLGILTIPFMISDNLSNLPKVFFLCKIGIYLIVLS